VDILKVLAFNNDRAVRETVVSSIFNYILDPHGDHGFGSTFLGKYLDALKGHLPFIDKSLLAGIEAYAKNDNLDIEVMPEWARGNEESLKYRRLDSLLRIRNRDQLILIGTEIKIYADSSSDKDQLDAYAEMLVAQKNIAVEEEGIDAGSINTALVYLVPGDSGKAFSFAATASKYCESIGVQGVVIVPWWNPDSGKVKIEAGYKVVEVAMDQLLRELLDAELHGAISPVDKQAGDVVRSLRNASLKHFDFSVPVSNASDARFPTNTDYEDALEPDHKILLNCFRAAAKAEGIKRPIAGNPRHTSIGIPAKENPRDGNNTLCRILTVQSYENPISRDDFVLQLSKPVYGKGISKIEEILRNFVIKVRMSDSDERGKPFYHENGKQNEEVYRINFQTSTKKLELQDQTTITGQYIVLLKALKEIFMQRV
jgi:hypothetical protein